MQKKFKSLYKTDIILDTNSIIDLQELDLLNLPKKVFNKVYISNNILIEELNEAEGNLLKQIDYMPLNLQTNEGFSKLYYLEKNNKRLSTPDKVVISIAYENNIICCTNDKPARSACESIGVQVTGTIGILCCAFEYSIIDHHTFCNIFNKYCNGTSSYINQEIANTIKKLYNISDNSILSLKKIP